MANSYFSVPDQYNGKTLQDVFNQVGAAGGYTPRADVLAAQSGIGVNSQLQKGQYLSYANDPGAGEYQFLQKNFGSPLSESDYQTKKATDANNAAVAPAISTLQSQVDPLKSRYDKLIADIKGRRDTAVQQAGIDTAREFGKRGISTQSGVYDVALRNATTPVEQSYGQTLTGAEGEGQDRLMAIQNAIAGLQAGAGKDAITQALQLLQNTQQQSNFEKEFGLKQQSLDLQKQKSANDPYGLFS